MPENFTASAFFARRNKFNSYTQRRPQAAWPAEWHNRLGHPGPDALRYLQNAATDVRMRGFTPSGLRTVDCNFCGTAKMKRQIRRARRHRKAPRPGTCLAIDIHDFTPDEDGYSHLILVTDRASGYCWDYYLKDKGYETTILCLAELWEILQL